MINVKKINKILTHIRKFLIQRLLYINSNLYMKLYLIHLKKVGINVNGKPNYIGENVYFDGADYSMITLNDNVTISREVMFLTHDYSMHTVSKNIRINSQNQLKKMDEENNIRVLEQITIGKNSFIGARVSILPGTVIGENVLVGACSVVKGNVPDNSIVVGNPAKIVGKTDEWLERKISKMGSQRNVQ